MEFLLIRASWSNDPEIRSGQVAKGYEELKSDVWTVRMGRLRRRMRAWKMVVSLPVLFVSLDSLYDLLALVEHIGDAVVIEEARLSMAERLRSAQSKRWTLRVHDDYIE